MRRPDILYSVFAGALFVVSLPISAGPILGPIGVSSPDPTAIGLPLLIDQSGLSSSYVSGVTDFDAFVATTTATNSGGGSSNIGRVGSAPPVDVDFDLGGVFTVESVAIWNQQAGGSASLLGFDLLGGILPDFSDAVLLGSFTMGALANPVPADVFAFSPSSARFLRVHATSNFGFPFATGFNEIAFEEASSVPEPSTFFILGAGLVGLVGYARRR